MLCVVKAFYTFFILLLHLFHVAFVMMFPHPTLFIPFSFHLQTMLFVSSVAVFSLTHEVVSGGKLI